MSLSARPSCPDGSWGGSFRTITTISYPTAPSLTTGSTSRTARLLTATRSTARGTSRVGTPIPIRSTRSSLGRILKKKKLSCTVFPCAKTRWKARTGKRCCCASATVAILPGAHVSCLGDAGALVVLRAIAFCSKIRAFACAFYVSVDRLVLLRSWLWREYTFSHCSRQRILAPNNIFLRRQYCPAFFHLL